MFQSNFQVVSDFLNDFGMQELMGFLFGAGIDWSDVDQPTTVSPAPTSPAPTTSAPPSSAVF